MRKASELFDLSRREQVNRAVVEAEAGTSAEIVPVVAACSGRYDRPEDIVGLWLGMIYMGVAWALYPRTAPSPGSWGGPDPLWEIVVLIGVAVVGFVLGAAIAARVGWLRRLFTPARQMREEVARCARGVFFDQRIRRTAGATGLLIYVSLCERMAAVLGDEAVTAKLGQPALEELHRSLVAGLKCGDVASALCSTIAQSGQRLAPVLPRSAADVNELPDALVVID